MERYRHGMGRLGSEGVVQSTVNVVEEEAIEGVRLLTSRSRRANAHVWRGQCSGLPNNGQANLGEQPCNFFALELQCKDFLGSKLAVTTVCPLS